MAKGIKDRVAILAMGCSRFGERWDVGQEELMAEAYLEALGHAGIRPDQIEAAWYSSHYDDIGAGKAGTPMAQALRLPAIGVTRVENFCAGGTEAFRGAVYAVASGAVDIALAVGVEKLKDTGFAGLPPASRGTLAPMYLPTHTNPGNFSQLARAYGARHNISSGDLKRAMGHTSMKSHANAVTNKNAHLRKAITIEQAVNAPMVADPLGLFDCCPVSDGAACAIVTTPEIARSLGKTPVLVKAIQLVASNGWEVQQSGWNGSYVHTARIAARRAYAEAGIADPRTALSFAELHDCFSITELVTLEDIGLADEGTAWKRMLDGAFDVDGVMPCQVDGGLKCFGHPVGASGLRMLYECWLQLTGQAGERQLASPSLALTHNLGGAPAQNVCSITIVGAA
ncbi:UNVERIFIED_ORG: acetyl-CoA C-acetyltransferase [Xanthobacter viscosus]|jgi:acetyl-CoA C-acetyltransferase|uniref:Acetyl-CoA acetyltransferase n=1 Tax=Xanthobacter autotrophicus TaxID=280 RepID=A0A6C1KG70_XANAU|nr:acetyl-CoA acetyltransferase [Xanthobacter autotrophicus]TLX42204.1 acetyl-CoA acetyltransferase [Xanthobacter autotrophicus]